MLFDTEEMRKLYAFGLEHGRSSASFGYRAPANFVVVTSIILAAGLMAATIYLIVDMDVPFGGPMSVSHGPIDRVTAALSR